MGATKKIGVEIGVKIGSPKKKKDDGKTRGTKTARFTIVFYKIGIRNFKFRVFCKCLILKYGKH